MFFFFFQAEDGIRDLTVTGVQTCALPIYELFGPAVAVTPFNDIDEAIALANDTNYGLAAGIFTENLEWAWKFAREVQSGNLHINWGPQWRAHPMPHGGLQESRVGQGGPAVAVNRMNEPHTGAVHPSSLDDAGP